MIYFLIGDKEKKQIGDIEFVEKLSHLASTSYLLPSPLS